MYIFKNVQALARRLRTTAVVKSISSKKCQSDTLKHLQATQMGVFVGKCWITCLLINISS